LKTFFSSTLKNASAYYVGMYTAGVWNLQLQSQRCTKLDRFFKVDRPEQMHFLPKITREYFVQTYVANFAKKSFNVSFMDRVSSTQALRVIYLDIF
jgi:hypothetical protein